MALIEGLNPNTVAKAYKALETQNVIETVTGKGTFEAMAESLRGGLSLGLCGFGFWSHDIGGFEGKPDPVVFKRWLQFGLLSSHSRLHGSNSYRVPWSIDEEASEVARIFLSLKRKMTDYLMQCAVESHETGVPVLRAMMLEYPEDPTCTGLDRQYMLGPDVLVAPVFTYDGTVEYYLPQGVWVHALDRRTVESEGRWYRETYPVTSLPVWIKADRKQYVLG
jgi:alpha-D-xyloside xylohydrolase